MNQEFLFKCTTFIKYGHNILSQVPSLAIEKNCKKLFILTGKHTKDASYFQNFLTGLYENKIEYYVYSNDSVEPTVHLVDETALVLSNNKCDGIIAIGGGSVLDTAKAISVLVTNGGSCKDYMFGGKGVLSHPGLPLFCVPTTAGSGSEVTASSVILDEEKQVKLSITHNYLFPDYALLDPLLHQSMPPSITVSTGMDALTHAIEAFTSTRATPLSDMYAYQAIQIIAKHILTVFHEPNNLEARGQMAIASSLAAIAFVNGGLGAVHGISQSIGGIAHSAHGITNAILLPYVMKLNYKGNYEKFSQIATALGIDTSNMDLSEAAEAAVIKIEELNRTLGISASIASIGVTQDMFPTIIEETLAYRLLPCNPVPVTAENILHILESSYQA